MRIILRALLLLAFATFLLARAADMTWHYDEILSYTFTRYPFDEVVRMEHDTHQPLWWMQFWVWWRVVGESEPVARYNAALITLVTLAVLLRIARNWLGRHAVWGILLGVLFCASPFLLNHMLDVRPYPLVILLATASFMLLARWQDEKTLHAGLAYGAVVALMAYTHYYLALLALAQGVYLVCYRPKAPQWRDLMRVLAFTTVMVVPALLILAHGAGRFSNPSVNPYNQLVISPYPSKVTNVDNALRFLNYNSYGVSGILLTAVLVGVANARTRRYALLALCGWAVPLAVMLALNLRFTLFVDRYMLFIAVAVVLSVVLGVAAIRTRVLRVVAAVAVLLVAAWQMPNWLKVYPPVHDLYRVIYDEWQAGDVVFNDVWAEERNIAYYWNRWSDTLPPMITQPKDMPPPPQRVWYINDNLFRDHVRRYFDAIEVTHTLASVWGQCNNTWCFTVHLFVPRFP